MTKRMNLVPWIAGIVIALTAAPAQSDLTITPATIGYWDAAAPGPNPGSTWEGMVNNYNFINNGAVYNAAGQYYDFSGSARMDGTGVENLYDFPTELGDGTGQYEPRTVVMYIKSRTPVGRLVSKTDESMNGETLQGWFFNANSDANGRWDFAGQPGGPGGNQNRWYDRTGDHGTDNQLVMIGMATDGFGDSFLTQWYLNGSPAAQTYSEDNLNGTLQNDRHIVLGAAGFSSINSANMELHFLEILNEMVDDQWMSTRWNNGSPLRGVAYAGPPQAPVFAESQILAAKEIIWTTITSRVYQPQFNDDSASSNWVDLGSFVLGDGGTTGVLDSARGVTTGRTYRVIRF
jgi:hypothetical protein